MPSVALCTCTRSILLRIFISEPYGPYIRRSNLANCKFTLELSYRTAPYRSKQKAPKEETLSEIEPVISSIAQGPAKNTIKIDYTCCSLMTLLKLCIDSGVGTEGSIMQL